MSTLSSIQTERVLAVLEESLDKLKFLGALTPDVLSHREVKRRARRKARRRSSSGRLLLIFSFSNNNNNNSVN